MGLIRAAVNATSGMFADQYKEYIYCDSMPENVLMRRGITKTSGRNTNTKGESNVITDGSVLAVAEGQCLIIVENGEVIDLCAEAGPFIFDSKSEPSIFTGNFFEGLGGMFRTALTRTTFGGQSSNRQEAYYINVKEIMNNKFGTPQAVPFEVFQQNTGMSISVDIRCFGQYSYKISNPMTFYKNVAGNIKEEFTRDDNGLEGQLKAEILDALNPAFVTVSMKGVKYIQIPASGKDLKAALNAELVEPWLNDRGIELEKVAISSVTLSDEDKERIKQFDESATYANAAFAQGRMVTAASKMMEGIPNMEGGGNMMGFMGMNMGTNMMGGISQQLTQQQQMAQQGYQQPGMAQPGYQQPGMAQPGYQQPGMAQQGYQQPGMQQPGMQQPGMAQPTQPEMAQPMSAAQQGWACSCGATNLGKFCAECGTPKPVGEPLYKCDKCGWKPVDPKNPPKFCPECGDRFDDNDKQ